MIRRALKNFAANWMNIFVAMGIIYLFLIIILVSVITSTVTGAGRLVNDVLRLTESTADVGSFVQEFADYAADSLNWEQNLPDALAKMADTQWLETTLIGFLQSKDLVVDDVGAVSSIVDSFVGTLRLSAGLGVSMLYLGIYAAGALVGYFVRRSAARRTLRQWLLSVVLQPAISSAFSVAALFLGVLVRGYALPVVLGYVILYQVITLFSAWLIYKENGLRLRDVLTWGNIGECFLSTVLIQAIDMAVFGVLALLNGWLAVLVLLPLEIYSLKIIEVNAASYVKSMIDHGVSLPVQIELDKGDLS